MTQDINKSAQPGIEATVLIDVSAQIRNTAFVVALIACFILLVAFVYRPATTDDDLFQAAYSSNISRRLVQLHGDKLADIFKNNLDTFDTPYDSFARGYLRSPNEDARTISLLNFLNTKKDIQRQYLLLLVEDNDIKGTLYEYLTETKTRWETFSLPVLDVKISRSSVLFCLCISFSALHGYYVVKHRYLLNIRSRFDSLRFLPDPSLLTATANDLLVLNGPLRFVVCVLQETILWILPISVCLVVLVFCIQATISEITDVTEVICGLLVCVGEAIFAFLIQLYYLKAKRAQWGDLFGNRV